MFVTGAGAGGGGGMPESSANLATEMPFSVRILSKWAIICILSKSVTNFKKV